MAEVRDGTKPLNPLYFDFRAKHLCQPSRPGQHASFPLRGACSRLISTFTNSASVPQLSPQQTRPLPGISTFLHASIPEFNYNSTISLDSLLTQQSIGDASREKETRPSRQILPMNTPLPPKKMVRFTTEKYLPPPVPLRSPHVNPPTPPKPALRRSIPGRHAAGRWDVFNRDVKALGNDPHRQHDFRAARRRWMLRGHVPALRAVVMALLCFVCMGLAIVSFVTCIDWALRCAGREGFLPRFAWG
ncbi:hypothetical protein ACRALDRAFT_206414 [Sodiomyces alcalophilus JCM 7366]|uniref:uncharacterized protein n=1 Tax=Sodiomyces alcalophilus JCM 7366 TaxID=591952 RepID=UPI0039B556EF